VTGLVIRPRFQAQYCFSPKLYSTFCTCRMVQSSYQFVCKSVSPVLVCLTCLEVWTFFALSRNSPFRSGRSSNSSARFYFAKPTEKKLSQRNGNDLAGTSACHSTDHEVCTWPSEGRARWDDATYRLLGTGTASEEASSTPPCLNVQDGRRLRPITFVQGRWPLRQSINQCNFFNV